MLASQPATLRKSSQTPPSSFAKAPSLLDQLREHHGLISLGGTPGTLADRLRSFRRWLLFGVGGPGNSKVLSSEEWSAIQQVEREVLYHVLDGAHTPTTHHIRYG